MLPSFHQSFRQPPRVKAGHPTKTDSNFTPHGAPLQTQGQPSGYPNSRYTMVQQQCTGFLQAFGCCTETLVNDLTKQPEQSSNSDSVIGGLVAHARSAAWSKCHLGSAPARRMCLLLASSHYLGCSSQSPSKAADFAAFDHAGNGTKGQKSHAARALWELAHGSDMKVEIAQAGGIAPLVALARDGTDEQKAHAAGTLASLSVNDDNKVAIAEAGGIPLLVALTRDGTEDQKTAAAVALANLAHNADNQAAIAQLPGGIKQLVTLVREGTGAQKTFADHALKQLALDADSQAAIAQAQSRYAVRSMRQSIADMTGIETQPDQVSRSAFTLPPLLPPGGFSSFNESCRAALQRLPVCGARVGGLWPSGLPGRVPPPPRRAGAGNLRNAGAGNVHVL
jgi:hypothetical protein